MNGDGYSRDGGRHGSSREYQSSRDDRRDRDRDRNRRRSRSPPPDFRGGGRPRREGAEMDTYSMSRSHRDREREDRYSGRDRRGEGGREREWDRDRDRRPPRDATYDDRRGARRGEQMHDRRDGHRDRDRDRGGGDADREFQQQQQQQQQHRGGRRSASPPPRKREPTPDLTDVTPVLERKRRLTQWDIKPPGYESVTAEQAKLSGMFPLPGAPRQQVMDPSKLQAFMGGGGGGGRDGEARGGGGGGGGSGANSAALRPANSRQSKRLLVSHLPPSATDESMLDFFNLQLNGLNVIEGADPCVLCKISPDRSFAILEFRSAADATVALAFDGITMEADAMVEDGAPEPQGLVLRRPKDYIIPAIVDDVPYEPGVVSGVVVDTPNKISISNIPTYLSEDQVQELLVSFGELKAFVLVKDRGTEEPRGVAFCEYVDPASTDIAVQGLNGMDIGAKRLKVQKASSGIAQVAGEMGVNAMSMLAGTTAVDPELSRVVQLLNMVTPEELLDQQDYEEIREDVEDECSKYGDIAKIVIPRPVGGSRQSPGVGKIYVKYQTPEAATKALRALAGRKFADRTVVTTYFPEENFEVEAW